MMRANDLAPYLRSRPPVSVRLVKAAAEQRFALGVAYPANTVDGHNDFAQPGVVEALAWEYLRNGREVGFYHADGTVGHGEVVESYIYRGPDWECEDVEGNVQTIRAGDWLLGAIFDETSWNVAKRQGMGWSMDGEGYKRTITKQQAAQKGVR